MQKLVCIVLSTFILAHADQKIVHEGRTIIIQSDRCSQLGQECMDNGLAGTCLEVTDNYYDSQTNLVQPVKYIYCEHNNDPQLVETLLHAANEGNWFPFMENKPTLREISALYISPDITLLGKALLAHFYDNARNAYVYEAFDDHDLFPYLKSCIDVGSTVLFEALLIPLATLDAQNMYHFTPEGLEKLQETGIYEYVVRIKEKALKNGPEDYIKSLLSIENFLAINGIRKKTLTEKTNMHLKKFTKKSRNLMHQIVQWGLDRI